MTQRLPSGWTAARISDLAVINPRDPGPDNDDTLVTFAPMAAVEALSGHLDASIARPWAQVKKGFTRFREGDVVMAKITPSMENGKVAHAVGLLNGIGAGTTELHVIRPTPAVASRYVMYWMLQDTFRRRARAQMTGTAGQLRVPAKFLETEVLPIAPFAEQARIVEAIESYLSRLDAAVASLERAQARLKAYRASVLEAAVEGRLVPTEAALARAEKREYEPADVLLKRILAERRQRWEAAELAKMIAAGKPPKNDRWKVSYVEPESPDAAALPELPNGWCWARVEQLYWDAGYGTSQKCAANADGPAVLRIPNISGGQVTLDDLKYATSAAQLRASDRLVIGDFLFIRTNGSKSLIGRGAPITRDDGRPLFFASYLIRLRLLAGVRPKWFATGWHSPLCRSQVLRVAASSAGQHNVSLAAAADFVIPLPPNSEQERILDALDEAVSVVDEASSQIAASVQRCARLRQSVLRWAFDGRLTDRDPGDEPADHLLDRIREMKDPPHTRRRTGFARPGAAGQGHAADG
jgi:type I restriction enzyme S subunit